MPKLLPNVREKLLARGGELLKNEGYAALSVRGIAKDCGMAPGTVYNYFKDKDSLVAEIMLLDWRECLASVDRAAEGARGPEPVLRAIHAQLADFAGRYRRLFEDASARRSFAIADRIYHGQLRASLARPLERFFPDPFLPRFIAEALLSWTMEGAPYGQLSPVLQKLCPETNFIERCDPVCPASKTCAS